MEDGQLLIEGIMENAGVLLAYLDPQFNFLAVNSAYVNNSGYTEAELIGKNHFDLFPNAENKTIFEKVRDTGESIKFIDKPFEYQNQPERGITYWDWTLTAVKDKDNQVKGLILSLLETTELKKTRDALEQSENKFHSLFTNMMDGCAYHKIILNNQGQPIDYVFLEVNNAFEKFTGLKKADVIGKKVTEIIPQIKNDPTNWIQKYGKVATTGQQLKLESYSPSLKRWYSVSAYCPEKNHFVTIFEDITNRIQMNNELKTTLEASQKRQQEISALLKASKAVLKYKNFKKAAKLIFESCKDVIGATAGYVALLNQELNQNDVLFLDSGGLHCTVDPSLIMPIRGLRAQAYTKGKAVYNNNFSKSEWTKFIPEGHIILKNVLFAPLNIDNETVGLIGIANKLDGFSDHDAKMASAFAEIASIALMNNRTLDSLKEKERKLEKHTKQLEKLVKEKTQKLQLAERMAAIGETAGMIGHDIRNPLQSMDGALYLANGYVKSLPEIEQKKELKELHELLKEQIAYIDHMVADLQDYAKPVKPQHEEVSISKLITESLNMIRIPKNIKLNLKIPNNPLKLVADPNHLKRIFVNLFKNSIQAMPKGGELTITAYNEDNDMLIHVQDNGTGIPEEAKPRIFTPLFTTKSKGQGFGLPVCKKLVTSHNGEITFTSETGKGTMFTVKLPKKNSMAM